MRRRRPAKPNRRAAAFNPKETVKAELALLGRSGVAISLQRNTFILINCSNAIIDSLPGLPVSRRKPAKRAGAQMMRIAAEQHNATKGVRTKIPTAISLYSELSRELRLLPVLDKGITGDNLGAVLQYRGMAESTVRQLKACGYENAAISADELSVMRFTAAKILRLVLGTKNLVLYKRALEASDRELNPE